MKRQKGFISSSSSVSTWYEGSEFLGYVDIYDTVEKVGSFTGESGEYSVITQFYNSYNSNSEVSWTTRKTNAYERIESFLEISEKINEPYSKDNLFYQSIDSLNLSLNEKSDVYNGFIDIVISFPTEIRLAGIELINPWVNNITTMDDTSLYWQYLPSRFNIYKVDNSIKNELLDDITYFNDIVVESDTDGIRGNNYRPILWSNIEADSKLILLGSYKDVDWKNLTNYKCFFKYNKTDPSSISTGVNNSNLGTATWKCKELVIRIFSTFRSEHNKTNFSMECLPDQQNNQKNITEFFTEKDKFPKPITYFQKELCKYIYEIESAYGTTVNDHPITLDEAALLCGQDIKIQPTTNPILTHMGKTWKFGGNSERSYKYVNDFKLKFGIEYKLGGIQLLLSPDIFSISEMKMYRYDGKPANKVYIGEWDQTRQVLSYYGAKTIKFSPYINISPESNIISWIHNFNVPPKYLDVKLYARFKLAYGPFNVGDVIENITDLRGCPLSIKVTDTLVTVNINEGIGFKNPETGEFMAFKNGVSIQMDAPGTYDAYNAAREVNANILDYGSSIASKISGDCPFQIYFMVKRLF